MFCRRIASTVALLSVPRTGHTGHFGFSVTTVRTNVARSLARTHASTIARIAFIHTHTRTAPTIILCAWFSFSRSAHGVGNTHAHEHSHSLFRPPAPCRVARSAEKELALVRSTDRTAPGKRGKSAFAVVSKQRQSSTPPLQSSPPPPQVERNGKPISTRRHRGAASSCVYDTIFYYYYFFKFFILFLSSIHYLWPPCHGIC